ncbi:MAG: sigma-70 family RNA polymerase sigma factor, partial [Mesorhizobium sp.]
MRAAAISAADVIAGDMALVRRALAREADAFRLIIKTHNQRLYRIARGVVRNDAEAEDIVQEAYMRAFASLDAFRGDASLSTWLSRITINEALGRLRKKKRMVAMPENPEAQIIRFPLNPSNLNPGDDPERT